MGQGVTIPGTFSFWPAHRAPPVLAPFFHPVLAPDLACRLPALRGLRPRAAAAAAASAAATASEFWSAVDRTISLKTPRTTPSYSSAESRHVSGLPNADSGLPDVVSGSGLPNAVSGLPSAGAVSGLLNADAGQPEDDVVSGLPNSVSGLPDTVSGLPDGPASELAARKDQSSPGGGLGLPGLLSSASAPVKELPASDVPSGRPEMPSGRPEKEAASGVLDTDSKEVAAAKLESPERSLLCQASNVSGSCCTEKECC